jgi:hypothetical protein
VEQVERREVDTKLEGLQNSVTRVHDLLLGGPVGMSFVVALLSSTVELIKDRAYSRLPMGSAGESG